MSEQKLILRKATRAKAKIRLGLSAVSGGGKTVSALLIGYGITGDWSKVAVVDTENNSADLYAGYVLPDGTVIGEFAVLPLSAPYSPERYIEAIKTCERADVEVVIIDSVTHEWDGTGGCLDIVESLGGKFQDWKTVTPRHRAFIDTLLQSSCHIITTVRRKQDYEMTKDSSGKVKVEKAGLKEVTREGFEYELTANLELDIRHNAIASKDRTGLFMGKPHFVPSVETGRLIKEWCETGVDAILSAEQADKIALDAEVENGINNLINCNDKEEVTTWANSLTDRARTDTRFRTAARDRIASFANAPKVEPEQPAAKPEPKKGAGKKQTEIEQPAEKLF
jgi:hypothetical protein